MDDAGIQAVVEAVYPLDCEIVTIPRLREMLSAEEFRVVKIPAEHNFSIEGSLEVVAAAVAVTRQLVLLYGEFQKTHERIPSAGELAKEAKSRGGPSVLIVAERLIDLAQEVLKSVVDHMKP